MCSGELETSFQSAQITQALCFYQTIFQKPVLLFLQENWGNADFDGRLQGGAGRVLCAISPPRLPAHHPPVTKPRCSCLQAQVRGRPCRGAQRTCQPLEALTLQLAPTENTKKVPAPCTLPHTHQRSLAPASGACSGHPFEGHTLSYPLSDRTHHTGIPPRTPQDPRLPRAWVQGKGVGCLHIGSGLPDCSVELPLVLRHSHMAPVFKPRSDPARHRPNASELSLALCFPFPYSKPHLRSVYRKTPALPQSLKLLNSIPMLAAQHSAPTILRRGRRTASLRLLVSTRRRTWAAEAEK